MLEFNLFKKGTFSTVFELRSENSINTGDHRHFIPKKLGRKYNAVSMNGGSPYKAMEI
jgi:hypothetical protein